jgi:hypothetical protein
VSVDRAEATGGTGTRGLVVEVFEECVCGTSPGTSLVQFLGRKLGSGVEVRLRDTSVAGTREAAPAALREVLEANGDAALPALVVNDRLYTQGWLPNFLEAVNLIMGRPPTEPIVRTPPGDAASCSPDACGPDGEHSC